MLVVCVEINMATKAGASVHQGLVQVQRLCAGTSMVTESIGP